MKILESVDTLMCDSITENNRHEKIVTTVLFDDIILKFSFTHQLLSFGSIGDLTCYQNRWFERSYVQTC